MPKRYTPAMVDLLNKAMEYSKTNYPSIPDHARPKPSYKTTDANGLTKAIVEWIDLSGGWATRISTEGRYIESLGKRIPSSVKKGTADIHAVWKGMHLSIEVKIGADRQSPEQKAIEADIKAAGGHYFIAKDFDSFHEWINSLELINKRFDLSFTKGNKGESEVLSQLRLPIDKVEVKTDFICKNTGNVAIEYKSRDKWSGITTTDSNLWAFAFPNDEDQINSTLLIKTSVLQSLVKKYINEGRAKYGGDDNTSEIVLIPLPQLIFDSIRHNNNT